jgi:Ca2+-binding RTX toxin-like protein
MRRPHPALPTLGISALVGLSTMFAATPAQAATTGTVVVPGGGYVEYKAATGKVNNLVITRSGDVITFDDSVKLKAGKGCAAVPGHTTVVTCTVPDPERVIVTLGDRNDTFVNAGGLRLHAYGGSGNDTLTGGTGNDKLDGGTGKDKLYGNDGNDKLYGQAGNDLHDAGAGNDELAGGDGNDTLVGRTGSDSIFPGAGRDVVWAGADSDRIIDSGAKSADVFHGGTGTDIVSYTYRTKGVVVDLDGVKGDDGEPGEGDTVDIDVESLVGGRGNDRLTGNATANVLSGSAGNDVLVGGDGDDWIDGSWGSDVIDGGAGADHVDGGDDKDTVRGGAGNDVAFGNNGFDTVYGDDGDDELYGWRQDDGGPPTEVDDFGGGDLYGGAGSDLCEPGNRGIEIDCER